jgi:hypothetical protein
MSEIKCNTCKITKSITNCSKIREQIECKDCKNINFASIMTGGRFFYIHGEQKTYDDLGVYGIRFFTSIDPKLRT